jgi:hypothetical protein
MSKVDAFEIPKPQLINVEMYNIEWATQGDTPPVELPGRLTVQVNLNDGNVIAQAIDKATEVGGYPLKDVEFKPIDFDDVFIPEDPSPEETLEYAGEVYGKEKL